MSLSKAFCLALVWAVMLITGCATALPQATESTISVTGPWRGRLAVRVASGERQAQPLSFTAGFELAGNPQTGALTLFTPLGTTLASLSWSDGAATLQHAGDNERFLTLDALIQRALGTEVPVAALFAWLAGDTMSAAGWSADLSNRSKGSIVARRYQPAPAAEIRLLLEE